MRNLLKRPFPAAPVQSSVSYSVQYDTVDSVHDSIAIASHDGFHTVPFLRTRTVLFNAEGCLDGTGLL
jgi:hypothetical protein